MPAVKKSVTKRVTRLTAKASPYHTAVRLYEADDVAEPSTMRRRVAHAQAKDEDTSHPDQEISDHTTSVSAKMEVQSSLMSMAATKSRSPKKPKRIPQSLDVPHPAPERWREAYDAIKEMRSRILAPVDTMGCNQAKWKEQTPEVGSH